MPNKPIPIRLFIRYLKSLGLIPLGCEGSHEKWNYPPDKQQLQRPIIIRPGKDKDVPAHHIRSTASSLGIDVIDLYKAVNKLK
jgi:hypothetical protein